MLVERGVLPNVLETVIPSATYFKLTISTVSPTAAEVWEAMERVRRKSVRFMEEIRNVKSD